MIKNKYSYCLIIIITLILNTTHLYSQNTMGAKSLSMGQTGTAIPESEWSVFSNPSLIPSNQNRVSFYGFRYVGLAEITDISTVVSLQSRMGSLAAGIHRYGFELFNETRMLVALKHSIERFHTGISISYYHISQGGSYGSAGAIGIHLGMAANISDRIWLGARVTNINQPSYGSKGEMLPRELAIGIGYEITDKLYFTSDIVKDVLFPLSFRAGLDVLVMGQLSARAGITTEPETVSFGFGYQAGMFRINFGLQQHQLLGLSPALDIGIQF